MKHYKKRTIALCLASVLTVVGAFGAENFKNSLMSIRINSGSNGHISITAFTEKPLENSLQTAQVSPNEFVLTLPETNNSTIAPMVTGYQNISDIKIATFPYTREQNGYTQITIKTIGSPSIKTNTMLFVPPTTNDNTMTQEAYNTPSQNTTNNTVNNYNNDTINKDLPIEQYNTNNSSTNYQTQPPAENITPADSHRTNYKSAGDNKSPLHSAIAVFWILVLSLFIYLIYIISKDKMDSVIGGGHSDFDLDSDNTTSTKNKKTNSTKKTTSKPSKTSANNINSINYSNINTEIQSFSPEKEKEEEQEEENVVLDLDSLFKEKKQQSSSEDKQVSIEDKQEEPENDDLAEFLNNFTFDEEQEEEPSQEELFDNELYEKIINNSKFKFSSNDMKKISQLIQVEISPDTIERLNKLAEDINNRPKPLSQKQVLESLLTTYSIKQNISFTKEDVDAIRKLMNVELDESFVTDLRTNPKRVQEVRKDIEKNQVSHKTSEIITMKVKDLLPDLSKELKKQGNRRIESEVKPQVVYFSEGYEVSKMSVTNEIADLTTQLKNHKTEEFKPSYSAPIVESGYEYTTLSTGSELPDLADVKAHPDKYKEKEKTKVHADEKTLLKNIYNVTFKPFYEEPVEEKTEEPAFVEEKIEEDITPVKNNSILISEKPKQKRENKPDSEAQKLLQLIEEQQTKRELKQKQTEEQNRFKKELEIAASKNNSQKKEIKEQKISSINIENESNILRTVKCDSKFWCHLVKTQNGYEIIGCTNNNQVKLKQYDELKSTNMQVRINDKMSDGKIQYLIKVGIQKFVVNVIDDNMEFVMDLC